MNEICALCRKEAKLQLSHIIPKFVFRWLKVTSIGGIRSSDIPNVRVQDGLKIKLLCADCEQLFSKWEQPFYEQIFLPLHDPKPVKRPIAYGHWALKFAISVSWRNLQYQRLTDMSHLSQDDIVNVSTALETWRKVLIGEIPHPQSFMQHLYPTDVIANHTFPNISPFLNRYLLRSIQMDILTSSSSVIVYTKLCRLLLFGIIKEDNPNEWKGANIHVKFGVIKPKDYAMPGSIFSYLNEKADKAAKSLASMSDRQKQKIEILMKSKSDEIEEAEISRAMKFDVIHSGESAFEITEQLDDEE